MLHPDPGDGVLAPMGFVGRPPFVWTFGSLGPVGAGRHRNQMIGMAKTVGILLLLLICPGPSARPMSISQRDEMIYIQLAGFLDGRCCEYPEPLPTVDLALPVALKCHRSLTLSDQDLVARVLTIVVRVGPVAPVIPIIWRELFGDVGHGDQ